VDPFSAPAIKRNVEQRYDGYAATCTVDALPATPLSHRSFDSETGGFASPPRGGFALHIAMLFKLGFLLRPTCRQAITSPSSDVGLRRQFLILMPQADAFPGTMRFVNR
jgi:hypothetical protein